MEVEEETMWSDRVSQAVADAQVMGISDVIGEVLHLSPHCPLCHREGKVLGRAQLRSQVWAVLMKCQDYQHQAEQFWVMIGYSYEEGREEVQQEAGHDPPLISPEEMLHAIGSLPPEYRAKLGHQFVNLGELAPNHTLTQVWVRNPIDFPDWDQEAHIPRQTKVSSSVGLDEQGAEMLARHGYRRAWIETPPR